jgi:3-phosphoshikimate 1-carboxyvinyltransferase
MKIEPARRIRGRLRLPGDKSISHRAAIISALACGQSRLQNFSTSEDCAATLDCLRQLGVMIVEDETGVVIVGRGDLGGLRAPPRALDCGNSGSTMRMLAGVLAGQDFTSTLTGDYSLRSRPMTRIVEPLEMMGARVESQMGRAPLRITGREPLTPIIYEMPIASAQVKSCLLFAGLNAYGRTVIRETPGATRDHTERMLKWYGAPIESEIVEADHGSLAELTIAGSLAKIKRGGSIRSILKARDGTIPGDISSAAFFIAAAALLPGSRLEINGVGLNPTRTTILSVLRSLGVDVLTDLTDADWEDFNEPFGDVMVGGGAGLAPIEAGHSNVLRGALIPQLIDEIPILAVLGTQVMGGLTIRDAAELRVKESDRIAGSVANLRAMGAEVEEYEDGLAVGGQTHLRGARLNSRGDHRIAMAFTVAALIAEGESEIEGAECVGVSFPEFFHLLASVLER